MKYLMNSIVTATAVAVLSLVSFAPADAQSSAAKGAAVIPPKNFATAQEAAAAVIKAAGEHNTAAILEAFGSEAEDIAASADPVQNRNNVAAFYARAQEKTTVTFDPKNRNRAILSVGNEDWPFPVPIVRANGKWHFHTVEGRDEIIFRHIGTNELDAIQICRGFVEAQLEYAAEVREGSKIPQYAQKIISTRGKQDGLYWTNADGTPGGPIAEPIAKAIELGYSANEPRGYHGYYFRVLKGQGPAAPFGQMDYVIDGAMIGGFALMATPVEYGVTGVKTFIISHSGLVYEKDLGRDTLNLAKKIEVYNPDKTWHRTDAEWPPDSF